MLHTKKLAVTIGSIALATSAVVAVAPTADAKSVNYSNCTGLRQTWAHGVGRGNAHDKTSSTPVTTFFHNTRQYNIAERHNKGLDRDKDGIACEKK